MLGCLNQNFKSFDFICRCLYSFSLFHSLECSIPRTHQNYPCLYSKWEHYRFIYSGHYHLILSCYIVVSLIIFISQEMCIKFQVTYKWNKHCTVENRSLYRVDISMSDCSNSWQPFRERWYITFLLLQCDISTFHKQLPTIWTIGHRYIYSIQHSVF